MNMPQTQLNKIQLNTTQTAFESNTIDFLAHDGYMLTGILYTPKTIKARIVVACATDVPQPFYRRFAEFSAAQGFEVLTFDYRGIYLSAPKQLKDFQMSYLDWGEHDLTGAIDRLKSDNLPLFMVGHSYGGQALGLTRNHHKVSAMYCYGTGAGWHGFMPFKERIKVQVIWNIVFPPMVAIKGYLPWSKLNMGADLPKGVYQQWRKWCKNPTYFFADPQQQDLHQRYSEVKTPIFAIAALDDDWALPQSRDSFMQHYRQAPMHYINISAKDYGLKTIGHMGYFRKGSEQIWQKMLDQFDQMLSI